MSRHPASPDPRLVLWRHDRPSITLAEDNRQCHQYAFCPHLGAASVLGVACRGGVGPPPHRASAKSCEHMLAASFARVPSSHGACQS
eukprot:scaffold171233_cov28-Tisochrysis_lutea.AAC.1